MKRRNFALLAGVASLPSPALRDRLGIMCPVTAEESSTRKTLAAAAEAGYRRVQVRFPWSKVDDAYLRAFPGWLKAEGLTLEVLSAYVNCASPATVLMDCRAEDLPRAIDYAAQQGCRRLIAWTGGYGAGLMKSDPRNFERAAEDAIVRFLEKHTPALEKNRLSLALETYITLACPDAPSLRRLLDRLPASVGAVMDPPNLMPVERYAERDQVLREMFQTLRGRIGVVHLKDVRLKPDQSGYDLPGPLDGELNYGLYLEQVKALAADIPVIAEHLQPAQFRAARVRLLERL